MLAFSEIIDFLLTLMRDETARAEFEQDPQGTLARAGLENVSGQDIADARLQLADTGAVSTSADDGGGAARSASYQDDADPVREINYTTQHYHVEDAGPADSGEAPEPNLPQSGPDVSIEDRNSFFFQTFNSDDDVTIIDDSFNTIDNSSVDATITNIDAENSFNTSDDDVVAIDADNSFNSSDDDNVVAIRDDDTIINDNDVVLENSLNGAEAPDGSLAAVSPPSQLPPVEPAAAEPVADEPAVAEPTAEEPAAEEPAFDEPVAEEPDFEQPLVDDPADDPVDDPAEEPAGDAADALPV